MPTDLWIAPRPSTPLLFSSFLVKQVQKSGWPGNSHFFFKCTWIIPEEFEDLGNFNAPIHNAHFFYPVKTSENCKVFRVRLIALGTNGLMTFYSLKPEHYKLQPSFLALNLFLKKSYLISSIFNSGISSEMEYHIIWNILIVWSLWSPLSWSLSSSGILSIEYHLEYYHKIS